MGMLSQPAFGPKAALMYITVGALMDVWTAVYYFMYVRNHTGEPPVSDRTLFWLVGFFLTGLTFVIIGLLLGQIGQAARRAELPPTEAAPAEANIQHTAAATPHPYATPAMGAALGGAAIAAPVQAVAPQAPVAPPAYPAGTTLPHA